GQVLLGLGHVAHQQVGLPDVLVRAPVLGIEAQGLPVVLEDPVHVRVRALADRVGEQVVIVGVGGVAGDGLLQQIGRARPVAGVDAGAGGGEVGIGGRRRRAGRV